MDDMRFYDLFNSISFISGRWKVDNERLRAMKLRCGWEDFTSSGDRTRSARSVGQRLTHWSTEAPVKSDSSQKKSNIFYILNVFFVLHFLLMVTKTTSPSNTDNLLLIFDADRKIPTRGEGGGGVVVNG